MSTILFLMKVHFWLKRVQLFTSIIHFVVQKILSSTYSPGPRVWTFDRKSLWGWTYYPVRCRGTWFCHRVQTEFWVAAKFCSTRYWQFCQTKPRPDTRLRFSGTWCQKQCLYETGLYKCRTVFSNPRSCNCCLRWLLQCDNRLAKS